MLLTKHKRLFQVLDPAKIIEHYTKTAKFKMDLLAILPFGTLYTLITGKCVQTK